MKDGTLDISGNAGYSNNWIQFGKISNLCFTTKDLQAAEITQGIQTADKLQMFYHEWKTEKSVAYGFFFDPADVELEVTACADVCEQYELLLKNGTIDPGHRAGKVYSGDVQCRNEEDHPGKRTAARGVDGRAGKLDQIRKNK